MNCARCDIQLPPGAAHVSEDSCIEALRHALAEATRCKLCGKDVDIVMHAPCYLKSAGNRAVDMGVDRAKKKAIDTAMEFFFGKRKNDES